MCMNNDNLIYRTKCLRIKIQIISEVIFVTYNMAILNNHLINLNLNVYL